MDLLLDTGLGRGILVGTLIWDLSATPALEAAPSEATDTSTTARGADPKTRSTSGLYNLHHGSIRIQNWGFYFLDPPRGLGIEACILGASLGLVCLEVSHGSEEGGRWVWRSSRVMPKGFPMGPYAWAFALLKGIWSMGPSLLRGLYLCYNPDPWEDPKSRIYFLDPPRGLRMGFYCGGYVTP